MGGRCEDCIFGKHATHPFNERGYQETEILERIHIDIWGPSPMQSAGGAQYFMMLIDGYLSYKTVAFLKSKSADMTLNVFETYHNKAERQTRRKLKQVRLNMGREWHNRAWEEYGKRHGLVFEFTAPYAHQQNKTVKRTLWTTLDGVRTALAESGLPAKYWADVVQTMTYVKNLIPLSQ